MITMDAPTYSQVSALARRLEGDSQTDDDNVNAQVAQLWALFDAYETLGRTRDAYKTVVKDLVR